MSNLQQIKTNDKISVEKHKSDIKKNTTKLENATNNNIIEMSRKFDGSRKEYKFITDKTFDRLTIETKKRCNYCKRK